MTLFSIIVPIYNAEKYLDECINSVIKQTYSNWELILIDDGSVDNSNSICNSFAKIDSRIKVFTQENSGPIKARIEGMKRASGDYLINLDADDYWDSNLLKELLSIIELENADMVVFNYTRVSDDGSEILTPPSAFEYSGDYLMMEKSDFLKTLVSESRIINIWLKAYKKELVLNIEDYKYPHITFSEDLVFTTHLLKGANRIAYLSKPLYFYRAVIGSMVNTFKVDKMSDINVSRKMLLNLLDEENISDKYIMSEFYNYYMGRFARYAICIFKYKPDIGADRIESLILNELYIEGLKHFDPRSNPLFVRITIWLIKRKKYNIMRVYSKLAMVLKRVQNKMNR